MKKIAFALLCVLILISCTAFSEQNNPEEYSITLDKSTITVKNGESVTVTVHVNAPEGASYLADHMRINTFALLHLEQRMEMILLLLLPALVMV